MFRSGTTLRVLTPEQEALLNASPFEIGLSERTVNHLTKIQVHTVYELLMTPLDEVRAISNVGAKTVKEIFDCLEQHGFHRTVNHKE